jgi:hypothetical protein
MKANVLLAGVLCCAVAGSAAAQHTFDGNIFYDNQGADCRGGSTTPVNDCDFISSFPQNDVGTDPLIADPYYVPADFPIQSPSFVPAANSIADGQQDLLIKVTSLSGNYDDDTCFNCGTCDFPMVDVCYRGAVEPGTTTPWYEGWTNFNHNGDGRTDLDISDLVIKTGALAADETWAFGAGAGTGYLLRGRVSVPAGVTLTIDAGVRVFGEKATTGYLVIERGGRILVNGTEGAPVIFTSDQESGFQARSDWGGVVLMGRGIANCADCRNGESCLSEGGAGDFCGNDDCDDLGSIRYARVEYAGIDIGENNELNAWTFNAVGCETTLEYLQSHMAWDDSFEWFGGKANGNHWIATGGRDDGFDWQMGFRGTLQFGIVQQYDDLGDSGIEADNNEFDFDAPCRSNPTLANLTFVGGKPAGLDCGSGIRLRRGTDATIVNSILVGWDSSGGLRVDDNATVARGLDAAPMISDCSVSSVDEFAAASALTVRTFPNPVVERASFQFQMPKNGHAELTVFDANGRMVDKVVDAQMNAGQHSVDWNAPKTAGTYYYRLQVEDLATTGRLVSVE